MQNEKTHHSKLHGRPWPSELPYDSTVPHRSKPHGRPGHPSRRTTPVEIKTRLHAPTKASIPIALLTIERTPVFTRDQQLWRSIGKTYMCNHGCWGSRLPSTYVRSGCIAPAATSAPGPGPSPQKSGTSAGFICKQNAPACLPLCRSSLRKVV